MSFEQGDIVAAEILFSNQVGAKLRPALVMSTTGYNSRSPDVVVFKITSKGKGHPFDVPLLQNDLLEGALKTESVVQADFPVVIERESARRIGRAKPELVKAVKRKIAELFSI